ncbi:uncharacterized protein MELLADRAFT_69974 [Melampsora larici-populina 98AG31]|uniref:Retrovirus-related Pol polyprotein from transposon TNT 1-94-like beta-barrel domain-containing protein n=1 Tax=Melampsora larici-populina (strain 98AG31 / pathotype 3-4-7) TaxID=747676 RepID=F4SD05_MELLP|nr:uncharacterized protein MELLADRAFT_69974 [Melampsora larici-populina 98AG31]EGF97469.1 hypothetical protein MELLADRAFT_69974 [Melampsora larici-populina 98AG31]
MHSNRDCKAKNNNNPSSSRPMQQQWSAPVLRVNSKPTQLSDADKIRLFDQAFSSRTTQSKPAASANAALAVEEEVEQAEDEVINLTTAYAAIATDSVNKTDFFMDTGSNKDIFNDMNIFKSIHKIRPVKIKSANGGEMVANQAGDVTITTYDFDNVKFETTLSDVLYCPDICDEW